MWMWADERSNIKHKNYCWYRNHLLVPYTFYSLLRYVVFQMQCMLPTYIMVESHYFTEDTQFCWKSNYCRGYSESGNHLKLNRIRNINFVKPLFSRGKTI